MVDLAPLQVLLARVREAYHPEQVWLFGSRARGEAGPGSDWDLLVVVPDDTSEDDLDLVRAWRLQKGSGVSADVVPCRASTFEDNRTVVNSLCYIVAHEGLRIDER